MLLSDRQILTSDRHGLASSVPQVLFLRSLVLHAGCAVA